MRRSISTWGVILTMMFIVFLPVAAEAQACQPNWFCGYSFVGKWQDGPGYDCYATYERWETVCVDLNGCEPTQHYGCFDYYHEDACGYQPEEPPECPS